jgi:hypothetical protein
MSLKIEPLPTDKDNVYNCELSKQDIIPRTNSNSIFSGASGSGKSILMVSLILKFYPIGTFDRIVLISPTCKGDDIQKQLHHLIDEDDLIDDLKTAGKFLEELYVEQREIIEAESASEAPRLLVIFDDCVADKSFTKLEIFTKFFITSRHVNATVFLATQSWTACPRRCRLQCSNVFMFAGSASEHECLTEEISPPGFTKKQCMKLISFCNEEPFSFLHYTRKVPHKTRYRRNLDEIVDLESVPL